MSDKVLRDAVLAAIGRLTEGLTIAVSVAEGVVTLSGEAPDEPRRILIEQEVRSLPTVRDVHNNLDVTLPPGDLRAQLLALIEREGARPEGIQIRAERGVVSLSGQAQGWFDRDTAERMAWTLPGVREVVNRVTLPEGAVEPEGDAGEGPAA